jgi:carbonic anhydrase
MKKLLDGIVDFRKRILPTCRDKFAELAKGQNPDALLVTCSDSRVAPNWFASTDPGDLFVVRNVGNLVPPAGTGPNPKLIGGSVLAAAEFSILRLNVSHIIVCGHSECGAMQTLLAENPPNDTPYLKSWLTYGEPALKKLKQETAFDSKLSRVNQLSQFNVLQQIEHLKSHSFIRKQVEENKVQIHGWWFDIAKADVYAFEKDAGKFKLIE